MEDSKRIDWENRECPNLKEFITSTEEELGLIPADVNSMNQQEFNNYIDWLYELWFDK